MPSNQLSKQVVTNPAVRRGGQRTHQNLRSELRRARRISSYQDSRRKSRREYRQWRSDIRSTVNLTLAQYCPPRKGCKLVFNSKFDPLVPVESPLAALPTPSFSVNSSNAIGSPFHLPAFRLGYAASTNCSTFVEHRNFARYWEIRNASPDPQLPPNGNCLPARN